MAYPVVSAGRVVVQADVAVGEAVQVFRLPPRQGLRAVRAMTAGNPCPGCGVHPHPAEPIVPAGDRLWHQACWERIVAATYKP